MNDCEPTSLLRAQPHERTAPPRVGDRLWAIQENGQQLGCGPRDDGGAGVEVPVSRDGELLYGRGWASRAPALEEADDRKVRYLRDGGMMLIV